MSLSTFSNTVLAADDYQRIEDQISKACLSRIYDGKFLSGSSCTGLNREIFFIGENEVTKVEFEKQKKVYDAKGDICTETIKTKASELPQGLSYSCKKGKYGQYKIKGKKVTFAQFQGALLFSALTTVDESVIKESIALYTKEKKLLKSLKTFKSALKNSNENTFSFPVIGSPCIGNVGVTMNGTGYKDAICVDGKVDSVEYVLNDKSVSAETFIKDAYKKSKEVNKLQLDNLIAIKQ